MKENKEEKLLNETVRILTENEYEEHLDMLIEMADLTKKRTGLKVNMWVDHGAINRNLAHSKDRIKIGIKGEYEVEIQLFENKRTIIRSYYPKDLYRNKGSNKTKYINEAIEYVYESNDLFLRCLNDKDEDYDEYDLMKDLNKLGKYKL